MCGWKGCSRLADGDDVSGGDGAGTGLAEWRGCCAGFGVGAAAGDVYSDGGRR
jgi:hypothetical protein